MEASNLPDTEFKTIRIVIKMLKKLRQTSGQDGGVGRHTVPPCTTKRRTTTI